MVVCWGNVYVDIDVNVFAPGFNGCLLLHDVGIEHVVCFW